MSVFGRAAALSKILWDRNGFDAVGADASLLFWAICLLDKSGILNDCQQQSFYQRSVVHTLEPRFPPQPSLLPPSSLIFSKHKAAEQQLEEVLQSSPAPIAH